MPRPDRSKEPLREGDRLFHRKDGSTYIRRRESIRHWKETKEWQTYWMHKRNLNGRTRTKKGWTAQYPDYLLTEQDEAELIRRFPEKGKHPSINGWHLGRIDHDKPYTLDNCKWEWYTDNIREMQKRIRYDAVIPIRCKHAFSYPLV